MGFMERKLQKNCEKKVTKLQNLKQENLLLTVIICLLTNLKNCMRWLNL